LSGGGGRRKSVMEQISLEKTTQEKEQGKFKKERGPGEVPKRVSLTERGTPGKEGL